MEDETLHSIHQLRHLVQAYEQIIDSMEDENLDHTLDPEEAKHYAELEARTWNNSHTAWQNEYASS